MGMGGVRKASRGNTRGARTGGCIGSRTQQGTGIDPCTRFRHWVERDVFQRMFEAVSEEPDMEHDMEPDMEPDMEHDMEHAMIDGTIVEVHRRGAKVGMLRLRDFRIPDTALAFTFIEDRPPVTFRTLGLLDILH